jgi:hypothetical protein
MLLYLAWWLSRHWTWTWVALVVLVAAVLLLMPAYPRAGATTLAPALIVAAFQFMTDGAEVAIQTLRPAALLSGAAMVLVILLRFAVFRKKPARSDTASGSGDEGMSEEVVRPPEPAVDRTNPGAAA